jgi:hypothetical protein
MKEAVEFGKVKMSSRTKVNEDCLVVMKTCKRTLEPAKCVSRVARKLGKVKKIEESTHSLNNM